MKVLTVLVELLRLVLTVLQGKQWQREVELLKQTAIGVSFEFSYQFGLAVYSDCSVSQQILC